MELEEEKKEPGKGKIEPEEVRRSLRKEGGA